MSPAKQAPSCHSVGEAFDGAVGADVIALVGSPNVGKSTLFNALTGARNQVGNWPGTTVTVGRGEWRLAPETDAVPVVDLPGAYSLDPVSPDEALTREMLVDADPSERPDVVVVVASAAHLSRGLYLLAQVKEHCPKVVLVVTMGDIAARRGVHVDAAALQRASGVPTVVVDPRHRTGLTELTDLVASVRSETAPVLAVHPKSSEADDLAAADARFTWVNAVATAAVSRSAAARRSLSDRIDRIATSPIVGPIVFLAVMWCVFQLTTRVAAPLQSALDSFFTGPVSSAAQHLLNAIGLGNTWVADFVINGLIAGVGMLLTFVPLMAIMFVLLALLEDSGYMARAAVVTDRLMRAIGLPGRAFLPLIVGFGCNVPAISATRVLPDARHRLLTTLLVPFTSCSARLTVYVLVATTFFGPSAGNVVFLMYVISIVLVVLVGRLLRSTLLRAVPIEPLVLDLPPYQVPQVRILAMSTWVRLRGFLRTASGVIVVTVALVWLLSAIPAPGQSGSFAHVPVQNSVYAGVAKTVAPVFDPAGFGSWTATSALMVGFVAKEAVISSWAQTYATAEPANAHNPGSLGDALIADFTKTSGGHTNAAVLAFLVFLLAYTPCVATLAAQRREIGRKWTAFGVCMQLVVAWILAVAIFQIGSLFS